MQKGQTSKTLLIVIAVVIVAVLAYLIFTKIRGEEPVPSSEVSYEEKMAACRAIPNNSLREVVETTRDYINLPKDVYPDKDGNLKFQTVSGNATAGWVSNSGPYGEAAESNVDCWSYYYEWNGVGEMDLNVTSALVGMPNYSVRFRVLSADGPK